MNTSLIELRWFLSQSTSNECECNHSRFGIRFGNDLLCNPYNDLLRCKKLGDGSRGKSDCLILMNCLVKMFNSPARHEKNPLLPKNILQTNRTIVGVSKRKFPAKISTVPNQSLTYRAPMRAKIKIVPKSSKRSLSRNVILVLADISSLLTISSIESLF